MEIFMFLYDVDLGSLNPLSPVHGIKSSRNVAELLEEHQVRHGIAIPFTCTHPFEG